MPVAARKAAQGRAEKPKAPSGQIFAAREREEVEKIFTEHGIPGYVGWGIYGAESSYGKVGLGRTGGYGFGLIMPSYNGKTPKAGDLAYNAEIAAETIHRLMREHGGLRGAVEAYSGGEYTLNHLLELGKGGPAGGNFHESHPGAGPEGLLEPGLPEPSIGNPLNTLGDLIGLLTSGETWLRLGEILAGALILLLGLKTLTGVELPSAVPVPV